MRLITHMLLVGVATIFCTSISALHTQDMGRLLAQPVRSDSWYKRTLDLSKQTWGDVHWLQQTASGSVPQQERALVFDAVMGRLVCVALCLERIKKERTTQEGAQEYAHVADVVDELAKAYATVAKQFNDPARAAAAPWVLDLVKRNVIRK